MVLLYAAKYKDVEIVVNISGRFFLERGIEGRLGKDYLKRIKENGFIDVRNRKGIIFFSFFVIDRAKDTWSLNSLPFFVAGKFEYRVTEESLKDRLTTNTHEACLSIHENCR